MSYSPLDKEASERLEDDFDNDRAVGQVSTVRLGRAGKLSTSRVGPARRHLRMW